MKTVRIREKIKKFLGDRPRNTAEILEHINSTMRHGTTSQQLGNVLSKDQVMEGIDEMISDIQVEATFPDGTKLVTVHNPIR